MRNILLILLVTILALAGFYLGLSPTSTQKPEAVNVDRIASIQHEPHVGGVGKPTFIILEEVHPSLKVQENIRLFIELLSTLGVKVIMVEGTSPWQGKSQPIDLSRIYRVGTITTRVAVGEAWYELGWLSGGELRALEDPSLRIFGVEDPNKYEEHKNKLEQQEEAWGDFYDELISLWEQLSEEDIYQLLGAFERVEQAEAAFEEPVEGAVPLKEAVEIIRGEIREGRTWREAIAALHERFLQADPDIPSKADLHEALTAARDALWDAIIEKAREKGLNTSQAEERRREYRKRREDSHQTMDERDELMISNALKALESAGTDVGILIIGAGHTPHIKELLERQGISYVVITPEGTRSLTTPQRESEWFERNLRGEKTPLEWWLSGIKPGMVLSQPEKQEAFVLDVGIIESFLGRLEAEQLPGLAGNLVESTEARRLPDGRIELVLYGTGPSSHQLHLTLHPEVLKAEEGRKQLIRHFKEVIGPEDPEDKRRLMTGETAIHVYDGGVFISFRPKDDQLFVEGTTYQGNPEEMAGDFEEAIKEDLENLGLTREKVEEWRTLQKDTPLAKLFAPMPILEAIVDRIDPILERMGVPEDETVVIPIRLTSPRKGVSPLRKIDFNLLYTLMKVVGVYKRPLVFVNVALEGDVDLERDLNPEHSVGRTLESLRHSGPTDKDILVVTVPTTEEEISKNLYTQTVLNPRGLIQDYQNALPSLQNELGTVKGLIGEENFLEPRDFNEFINGLRGATRGVTDATIAITLVVHQPERFLFNIQDGQRIDQIVQALNAGTIPPELRAAFSAKGHTLSDQASVEVVKAHEEWRITDRGKVFIIRLEDETLNIEGKPPYVYFKEERKELDKVLDELKRLQDAEELPSRLNLEFILITCYGEEWVEPFIRRLGARAILRTPFEVDLPTEIVFYRYLMEEKREGRALYIAYQGALKKILKEVLEGKAPDEVKNLRMIYPVSKIPSSSSSATG